MRDSDSQLAHKGSELFQQAGGRLNTLIGFIYFIKCGIINHIPGALRLAGLLQIVSCASIPTRPQRQQGRAHPS